MLSLQAANARTQVMTRNVAAAGASLAKMESRRAPQVWTVTDDRAGNRVQAQALGLALGGISGHIQTNFSRLQTWLAPHWLPGMQTPMALPATSQAIDIVIGCGRQSALALRLWKRQQQVFTVQILDPRISTTDYDLVIAPAHDELSHSNVLRTLGALNPINAAWLAQTREANPHPDWIASPLSLLLIGGPHTQSPLTLSALLDLLPQFAARIKKSGGSALICGSRRTPSSWQQALRQSSAALHLPIWLDGDDGDNPYRSALAYADEIIVTADSVNMVSEACATQASVIPFSAAALSGKLARFHQQLQQTGRLSSWTQRCTSIEPLRETERIAAEVLQRWRQSRISQ